jgi:hypothetical protein
MFYLRSIIMKNLMLMLVVLVVVSVSGCQMSKGLFEDVAGSSAWVAEKLEKPAAEAAERDADRAARKLEKRQAILAARVRLAKNEVQ